MNNDPQLKQILNNIKDEKPIWFEQPAILFSIDDMTHFYPTSENTHNENMNAVVRFSLYLSIILVIIKRNYLYAYIFLLACLVTFLLSKNNARVENLSNKMKDTECQESTKNNPFMNVLMSDYKMNPKRKACKIDNNVRKMISKNFNHNLYKDVSDVYEKSNSQRQYYTMPSTTIPNDQSSFAKWLYKVPSTCKSGDGSKCYELQPKNMHFSNQLYKYI